MSARGPDAADPRERLRAIESAIEDLSRVADARSLAGARALVAAVLSLHADGIGRIVELARSGAQGAEGASLLDAMAADDLAASLLLLHGLHPTPLDARVRAALAKVAPVGWALELASIGADGVVRIDAIRAGDGQRAARAEQVRPLVEQAVEEAAPDAEGVEVTVEGEGTSGGFVPIERLTAARPAAGGVTR
jgi:hypothetical protein